MTGKEMKPIVLKNISTLTGGEKRFAIRQAWGNDPPYELESNNSMLSDAHLRVAYETKPRSCG